MSQLSTHTTLHSRMSCFISWIKPDPDKKEENARQAGLARKYTKQNAEEDGMEVISTPPGGSDEKGTGLRRHYLGHSEIDGYDIDIPIVIRPEDAEGKKLEELLSKFEGYVRKSYPDSEITLTNSSVNLRLSNELSFDIVPMFSTDKADEQVIIKKDGIRIRTSVQKHNEFVKKRTRKSKEIGGRVTFNECVRAMKWWKEFQADHSYYLDFDEHSNKDNRPPSALIDWLAAYAFDKLGVEKTYAETLAKWFGFLANIVRNQTAIYFIDYYSTPSLTGKTGWIVLDPVNPDNNITGKWQANKLNEFASWFEKGRDSWNRIIRYDIDGEDNLALDELVKLFGNPFKNHCEEEN
jgi:tRNA nucleotidyltransferase (CCA-adding enzyme)